MNFSDLKELLENHPEPVYGSQINIHNIQKWFKEFKHAFTEFEKQLQKAFNEFPDMDDPQFWTEPSSDMPIIDGKKPDKMFRAVRYSASVLSWKKKVEKEVLGE